MRQTDRRTYIHSYIHTYIQTDRQTDRQTGKPPHVTKRRKKEKNYKNFTEAIK